MVIVREHLPLLSGICHSNGPSANLAMPHESGRVGERDRETDSKCNDIPFNCFQYSIMNALKEMGVRSGRTSRHAG